jgi:hypothetical protein
VYSAQAHTQAMRIERESRVGELRGRIEREDGEGE